MTRYELELAVQTGYASSANIQEMARRVLASMAFPVLTVKNDTITNSNSEMGQMIEDMIKRNQPKGKN